MLIQSCAVANPHIPIRRQGKGELGTGWVKDVVARTTKIKLQSSSVLKRGRRERETIGSGVAQTIEKYRGRDHGWLKLPQQTRRGGTKKALAITK